MNDDRDYLLGTSDAELERLGYQHQVWLDESVELWRAAEIGLGDRLLDLGCGPGFATLDLARLVGPHGRVHAVDASEKYIGVLKRQAEAAGLPQIVATIGDARAIDLDDACVDAVFARWVLCFMDEPERVVAETHRILRPGGALIAMDYFNYRAAKILPSRASFEKMFASFSQSVIDHGGSYDIGDRLPQIAANAGFNVELLRPICRIARPGSRHWNWLELFRDVFVPQLVDQGMMTVEERRELDRDFAEATRDPAAFFFSRRR